LIQLAINDNTATSGTGRGLYLEVGDGTASLDSALAINHTDTGQALTSGITITGAASTAITTAIDLSDPEIASALSTGLNDLSGSNWSITGASGNITSGTINGQTISSTANFTGTVQVVTSLTSPLYTGIGAVTLSSAGGNALTLDSSSGNVVVASGDTLQIQSGNISSNNTAISIDSGSANQVNLGASDTLSNGTWTITGAGAVSGVTTISAGTNETINGIDISAGTVSDVDNLTINTGGDLTIGLIGLNDLGTSNLNSGASLIGAFDEFANSNSTNIQDVLDDFDAAIGSGASKWTDSGTFTYLTSVTDDLVIGSTTVAAASLFFDESAADLFLGTNESLSGRLTLYSSGVGITDPVITVDTTGNLITTSANFNTTATGINSTAVGATTPSTAAFTSLSSTGATTLGNNTANVTVNSDIWDITGAGVASGLTGITSSGTITFSGLSTTGIVHNNASGVLSTSAINLAGGASEITGILPVGNGGTGLNTSTVTDGQLLIGNDTGNGFSLAALTAGNGITVTNGAGTISLAANVLTTADGTGSSSNNSGLEFAGGSSNQLALLQNCSDDFILKWDEATSTWNCEADAGSGTGSSKWTDSGGVLYPNTIANDLAIGNTTAASAVFGVDTSANTVFVGDGSLAGSTTLTFKSDAGADTGNLLYNTSDQFQFSGGNVLIDQTLLLSTGAGAGISGGGLSDCDGATQKLVWDVTTEEFGCGTDSGSGAGGSKWTTGSTSTYLTDTTSDLTVGAGDTLTAPFSIDVSANRIRIGDGADDTNTPGIDFYASNSGPDTGSLIYTDSDQFDFTLGDVLIDQKLSLPAYSLTANGSRSSQTTTFATTTASQSVYGSNLDITNSPVTNANTGYGYYATINDSGSLVNTVYGGYFDATTTNSSDLAYGLAAQGDTADILLLGGKINSNNIAVILDSGSADSVTLGSSDALNISGNFAQTGATTLSTGTGTISVNGNTTFASGTTITQSGTGQVSFGGNVNATNGLDVTGADFTVGGSNFSVAPATGNTLISGTLGVTGLITASGGITLPANQNLTLSSGTGTISQTFANTTGSAATFSVTNSAASGTNTVNAQNLVLAGTVTSGTNTNNGLNFADVTGQSNNTFNAINIGTGYDNFLVYNNGGFTGSLRGAALTGNRTYTLPNASGTICLDSNNCTFVSSFDVSAEAGPNQTITSGDTLIIAAGTGIDTVASATHIITVSVQANSLDFTEFQDTLDLDAALTLNQGSNSWTQNYSGTGNGLTLAASSTGTPLSLTSSSTGNLLSLTATGTGTTAAGIQIANTSTGAITTAIDISDAEIGTALAIGSNDVTVGGATIASSEFAILDNNISLTTEVTGVLPVGNGGTGTSTTPTSGQLLIGNASSGYNVATLTDGTGITITEGSGSITIDNSGVLSLTGTANQVNVSGATGNITLSTPQNIHTAATPTFAGLTLSNTTNQITLGTTNTTTISSIAPSASRTYTLPDFGSNDTFVGLAATQTLSNKSLSDATTYFVDSVDPSKIMQLELTGVSPATTRTLTVPDASGIICISTGNCAGSTAGIGGSGTANTLTKFTGTYTVGDASITDTGSLVTFTTDTDLSLAGTENLALSNSSASTDQLSITASGVVTDSVSGANIAFTQADDADATDTNSALRLAVTSSSGDADALYGLNIANITAGTANETAINIGTGWDQAINAGGTNISLAELQILDANINLATEVTGTLPVGNGGTGATSLTLNGILYGNTASAIGATAAGTNGQLLVGVSSSAPTFVTMSNDATISNTGALTISADAVALGTDTTGNYVGSVTSGSGISVSGTPGEGFAEAVSLGSLTANWSQTGAFDIVLNNSASELGIRSSDGAAFYGYLDVAALAADKTYTLPTFTGSSADICLSTGNCTGSSAGIGGTGTAGEIAFFTAAQTIASENNFKWDATNDVLSLGTAAAAQDTTALLDIYGESEFLVLRPADITVDSDTNNSSTLRLRGTYDSNPAVGPLTSSNFNFDIKNIMTAAGASPTSKLSFINNSGSEVLALTSDSILSLSTTGLIDLSTIAHGSTAVMGLKLPQTAALSTGPSAGEGFLAYESGTNLIKLWTGASWENISGASTTLQQAYDNDAGSDDAIILTDATGNIIIRTIGGATDTQFAVTAASAPEIDIVNLTNSGFGTVTNNVDALASSIFTAAGTGANNSAIHAIIGNAPVDASDVINGIEITGFAQTVASTTQNLLFIDAASSGNTAGNLYGIAIDSITANTATEHALRIGTGWDDILNYNGTTVINGTGQIVAGQITGTLFTAQTDTGVGGASAIVQGDTLIAQGDTNGIDVTNSGDTLTFAFDGTEVGAETWGTGTGFTWTFDAGTTDPTLAFADNQLTIGGATTLTATAVTDFDCTDCIDFDDIDDTLTLDASTSISVGANQLSFDLDGAGGISYNLTSSGTVSYYGSGQTYLGFEPDQDITYSPLNGGEFTISPDLSENNLTGDFFTITLNSSAPYNNSGNLIQLSNLDVGSTAALIDISQASTGQAILFNTSSTGDFLELNSSGAVTTANGILIEADHASGVITDALDVSDAEIVNALNIGANTILGTTGDINLDNFDVTGASGNVSYAGRLDAPVHQNNSGLNLPTNAGAPVGVTGTAEGDVVYDSTGNALYVYDGAAFTQIGGGGYSGWNLDGDDADPVELISSGETALFAGGTNGIDTDITAANTLTLNLDYTEITTATFGTGSGWTWTFDAGTTDPTLAFADNQLTIGGATTLTATAVTDFDCTDCIDFDDITDSATLDASTAIGFGAGALNLTFTN
ncbi:MAG: hypothetical protein WC742_15295, partial [Gallionellaceae bacterium]